MSEKTKALEDRLPSCIGRKPIAAPQLEDDGVLIQTWLGCAGISEKYRKNIGVYWIPQFLGKTYCYIFLSIFIKCKVCASETCKGPCKIASEFQVSRWQAAELQIAQKEEDILTRHVLEWLNDAVEWWDTLHHTRRTSESEQYLSERYLSYHPFISFYIHIYISLDFKLMGATHNPIVEETNEPTMAVWRPRRLEWPLGSANIRWTWTAWRSCLDVSAGDVCSNHISMDWFKGNFTGKAHI